MPDIDIVVAEFELSDIAAVFESDGFGVLPYQNVEEFSVELLTEQGPAGPKGVAGRDGIDGVNGSCAITAACGEILSALKVVRSSLTGVRLASADDGISVESVLGITLTAANLNESVQVIVSGEMQDASWNWVAEKKLFLGLNGNLTQSVPTTGQLICLGVAITANKILVHIRDAITRL